MLISVEHGKLFTTSGADILITFLNYFFFKNDMEKLGTDLGKFLFFSFYL